MFGALGSIFGPVGSAIGGAVDALPGLLAQLTKSPTEHVLHPAQEADKRRRDRERRQSHLASMAGTPIGSGGPAGAGFSNMAGGTAPSTPSPPPLVIDDSPADGYNNALDAFLKRRGAGKWIKGMGISGAPGGENITGGLGGGRR